MELQVIDQDKGAAGSKLTVSDDIFAGEFNEGLVHQVVTAYMAGGRAGTKAQKNRSDVSGGGIKPFRQKGTGRARAGTIRSPIWIGGGVTFAARPRDYSQKINKKMRRAAMISMLSELVRQDRLVVVDAFTLEGPKTKQLVTKLNALSVGEHVLVIVAGEAQQNVALAARNLPHVNVSDWAHIDPVSLVKHKKILVTTDALKKLEERLS